MDIKDKSLREALAASACRELPRAWRDGDGFWVKAIVLVRKRNNTQSYALAERGGDGLMVFTKDFGLMSQIVACVSIHPYIILDEGRFLPMCGKLAMIRFFGEGRREEILNMPECELDALRRDMAIALQMRNAAQDMAADAAEEEAKVVESSAKEEPSLAQDKPVVVRKETAESDSGTEDVQVLRSSATVRRKTPKKRQ